LALVAADASNFGPEAPFSRVSDMLIILLTSISKLQVSLGCCGALRSDITRDIGSVVCTQKALLIVRVEMPFQLPKQEEGNRSNDHTIGAPDPCVIWRLKNGSKLGSDDAQPRRLSFYIDRVFSPCTLVRQLVKSIQTSGSKLHPCRDWNKGAQCWSLRALLRTPLHPFIYGPIWTT
jgi:hypothetical protein